MNSYSVVIPTYNGREFVQQAIRSVCNQTILPLEIIVVDDCSTDDTTHLVQEYMKTSSIAVRLLLMKRNSGGPAAPINLGVDAAQGDWIGVVEQDDVLLPNAFERRLRIAEHFRDVTVSGGRASVEAFSESNYSAAGELRSWPMQDLKPYALNGREFLVREGCSLFVQHGMFLNGFPGFVFQKNAWKSVGGINESLRITGDYDFICRLTEKGTLALVDEVVYCQRSHQSNLSKQTIRMEIEDLHVRAYWVKRLNIGWESSCMFALLKDAHSRFFWLREGGKYTCASDVLRMLCNLGYPRRKILKMKCLQWLHSCLSRMRIISLTGPYK